MQKRSFVVALVVIAALLLGSAQMIMAQDMVIKIAVNAPQTGSSAANGIAVANAVQLAVEQLGTPLTDMGYTLEVVTFDDASDADTGVANAEEIVADAAVLGVIGHVNSGVAIPSSEIYDAAGLAVISPAVTNPNVTDRALTTVNRLSGRDDVIADVIVQQLGTLGAASVYIVNDESTYGTGLAELVAAAAEAAGLTVAGNEAGGDAAAITAAAPDAVVLAGGADYGTLVSELRAAGYAGTIIAGDGIDTPTFAENAGEAAVGVYYVTTGAPAATFEGAATFIEDYNTAYEMAPAPNAVEAYDATGILLAAIARAAEAAGGVPTREAVAAEVRATADYEGLSGMVTFDANGDRAEANYFVVEVGSADPAAWGDNAVVNTIAVPSPLSGE